MPLVVVNSLPYFEIETNSSKQLSCHDQVTNHAINTVQPENKAENNVCTLMLLTNLAEPQWISVSCSLNIAAYCYVFYGQKQMETKICK